MKILVPIKRVVDYRVKIRVKSDDSGIVTEHVKMSMNPFDEIAIEEAVRLKEKQIAEEVIAVSIGNTQSQETLRMALAMGATKAILIETSETLFPKSIASILQHITRTQEVQLVMMGKQAIDNDFNQTAQMLAARLQWPMGAFISKIEIQDNKAIVTREVDAGLERLQLNLPAVVSVDLRLNQPRIPTLPNIMQAKQKSLEVIPLSDLALDLSAHYQVLKVEPPPPRVGGKILANIDSLIDVLKQEKIIP